MNVEDDLNEVEDDLKNQIRPKKNARHLKKVRTEDNLQKIKIED